MHFFFCYADQWALCVCARANRAVVDGFAIIILLSPVKRKPMVSAGHEQQWTGNDTNLFGHYYFALRPIKLQQFGVLSYSFPVLFGGVERLAGENLWPLMSIRYFMHSIFETQVDNFIIIIIIETFTK